MKTYEYCSGTYGITLTLTVEDVVTGYHSGSCDESIAGLRLIGRISDQLKAIDAETLRKELKEYGSWDEEQLADHDENLNRFLWLACGDIAENPQDYESI